MRAGQVQRRSRGGKLRAAWEAGGIPADLCFGGTGYLCMQGAGEGRGGMQGHDFLHARRFCLQQQQVPGELFWFGIIALNRLCSISALVGKEGEKSWGRKEGKEKEAVWLKRTGSA
ncbi:hypothetical protein MHYP_G00297270 [Metynnis hypsauchen]